MMQERAKMVLHTILIGLLVLTLMGGAAAANPDAALAEKVGALPGYLANSDYPDSLKLLPPPPAPGSVAFAMDEDVARRTFAVRDTARFAQALSDYTMSFPHAAGTFSCALNAPVTEQDTPRLYQLLRRTLTDAGLTTYAAKEFYQRQRPFVLNKQPICAPETRAHLEKDGSYPSGHTTVGWAWALILTEISPDQADAILARARTFGESRNVCNHHWFSDVDWGRTMGAVIVARLHASAEFQADLAAAKLELAAVREQKRQPTRDCGKEAAALAIKAY
jgi:acid phosphatase (class A)